jgi:hypothetical protein
MMKWTFQTMSLAAIYFVMKLLKNPPQRLGSNGSGHTIQQHPFFKGND